MHRSLCWRIGWIWALILTLAAGCRPAVTETSIPSSAAPTTPPTAVVYPVETGTETAAIADACLPGTWYLQDFNTYLVSIVPADVLKDGKINFKDTSGEMQYIFSSDGTVLFKATRFTINAEISTNGVAIPLVIIMDGNASAHVAAEAQQLTFTDEQSQDAVVSITVADTPVLTPTDASQLIWWDSTEQTLPTAYTCGADTLELTPPVDQASPVVFARMDP